MSESDLLALASVANGKITFVISLAASISHMISCWRIENNDKNNRYQMSFDTASHDGTARGLGLMRTKK